MTPGNSTDSVTWTSDNTAVATADANGTVTAVALGVQKAGLAKLCQEGDRSTLARNRLSIIAIFGPLLFIPVVLVGVALAFWLLGKVQDLKYAIQDLVYG